MKFKLVKLAVAAVCLNSSIQFNAAEEP
ncbi:MAG: hypothetical protein ACI9FO_001225, partial [Methylophagaceae bacterium]